MYVDSCSPDGSGRAPALPAGSQRLPLNESENVLDADSDGASDLYSSEVSTFEESVDRHPGDLQRFASLGDGEKESP